MGLPVPHLFSFDAVPMGHGTGCADVCAEVSKLSGHGNATCMYVCMSMICTGRFGGCDLVIVLLTNKNMYAASYLHIKFHYQFAAARFIIFI